MSKPQSDASLANIHNPQNNNNYNRGGNDGGGRGNGGRGGGGRGGGGYHHGGRNGNHSQQYSNQQQEQYQENYGGDRGRGRGRESGGIGSGLGRGQQSQRTPANPRQNVDRVPEVNAWSRVASGQPALAQTQTLTQNRNEVSSKLSTLSVIGHSKDDVTNALLPIKCPDRGTHEMRSVTSDSRSHSSGCIRSKYGLEEALQVTKVLAEDCRSRGTAFRLGAVLRDVLEQFLPDDAHIRSNGRVRVAVTQILWRPRGLLVDQFDSREDLIDAVITSSFIPGYLAPRPATLFRNRLCVDGGLTLFMPPTSAAQTVRVCAFPAGRLGLEDIGISPDCNPENRASAGELFSWALEPAADSVLDNLYELGYMDAAVWAALNPVEDVVQEEEPMVRS
uniref:Patatin n=1 Tax=Helianthus annuus TaxID=4232 RepID=A0A251VIZ4_HELAN